MGLASSKERPDLDNITRPSLIAKLYTHYFVFASTVPHIRIRWMRVQRRKTLSAPSLAQHHRTMPFTNQPLSQIHTPQIVSCEPYSPCRCLRCTHEPKLHRSCRATVSDTHTNHTPTLPQILTRLSYEPYSPTATNPRHIVAQTVVFQCDDSGITNHNGILAQNIRADLVLLQRF